MRLNNKAITKTKKVKSMRSKLPQVIKTPSNTCFSLPNPDQCLFFLWTILSASYGINIFPSILHSVLRVLSQEEEGPQPLSTQDPLWLCIVLRRSFSRYLGIRVAPH